MRRRKSLRRQHQNWYVHREQCNLGASSRLQLLENIFEKKYAHTLLAFTGTADKPGRAVGIALYFFNFSTWYGDPQRRGRLAYHGALTRAGLASPASTSRTCS